MFDIHHSVQELFIHQLTMPGHFDYMDLHIVELILFLWNTSVSDIVKKYTF